MRCKFIEVRKHVHIYMAKSAGNQTFKRLWLYHFPPCLLAQPSMTILKQGWGVEEHEGKKAPLSENKLLRKEDLGLTVTEMGSLGNGMDRSGRKDLPGRGKAVVETRVCFLKLRA